MKHSDLEKMWEIFTRCGVPIKRHTDKSASLSTITIGSEYLGEIEVSFTFDNNGDLDDVSAEED